MLSKRTCILLGVAIPVVALLALLAWASARTGGSAGGFGINADFGQVNISPRPARDFSLELLDGGTLSLSDLQGKVVMLDFWASWCPPCRQEAPAIAQVYQEYADQPVEFVGVDIWDREEDAREYLRQFGITYPNGVDSRGSITIDYGVRGIPEKFFISPDGTLVKKFVGPVDADTLRATLDELLSASESGVGEEGN